MIREWLARLLALVRRRAMQARFEEELRLHRDLLAADLAAAGSSSSPDRELGAGSIAYRDAYHDRLGIPALEHAWTDTRYALRVLGKHPGFSLVSILTLALGIGGSTAMFCLLYHIVLKPLAYPDPDRLAIVWGLQRDSGAATTSMPNYLDFRAQTRTFAQLAAWSGRSVNLTAPGLPEVVPVWEVSDNFFQTIGIQPAVGRPLDARDTLAPTAVISHSLWVRRFGAAPETVGRTIELDAAPLTIVGIMPAGFDLPARPDVWTMFGFKARNTARSVDLLMLVGRLQPAATITQADAELRAIAARLEAAYPSDNIGRTAEVRAWHDDIVRETRTPLAMLFAAVSVLLLIACANIALLMLARATARRQEIVTRTALGASRARVLTQLLAESLLLAAAGTALGVALAHASLRAWLRWAAPATLPRLHEIAIDHTVLAFACATAVACTVLFSLLPLRQAVRIDLATALRGRGLASPLRAMPWLVASQALLATVLVVGAGLLVRSLDALRQIDPGYRAEGILSGRVTLPDRDYRDPAAIAQFHERLLDRLRAAPGVQAAVLITQTPAAGSNEQTFSIQGQPVARTEVGPATNLRAVTEGYLRTVGIRLVAGRDFTADDRSGAPLVALVNEALVRRYFNGRNPIGARVAVDGPEWRTVVGVVADTRQAGLASAPGVEMLVPMAQRRTRAPLALIRTGPPPETMAPVLRAAVAGIDPRLTVSRIATLEEQRDLELQQPAFRTALLAAFAAVALLLVSLGVYGMTSYAVSRRTAEFGLRMALGATGGSIGGLVLRSAGRLSLIGAAAGLGLAALGAQAIGAVLFGVRAHDPLTFAAAPIIVLLTGVAAAAVPARRATRVDPITALRAE